MAEELNRPATLDNRTRALIDATYKISISPGQIIFDTDQVTEMIAKKNGYVILKNNLTGAVFTEAGAIRNVNTLMVQLRRGCSQCQQVVKFMVEAEVTGWTVETYALYDMAMERPVISNTGSLAKLRTVCEAIILGESIRVAAGGTPLNFAVWVAGWYASLIGTSGALAARGLAIEATGAARSAIAVSDLTMDPFITWFQDLVLASGGGQTKAQIKAIGIAYGLKYISIGDPSTFIIEFKDDTTNVALPGPVASIGIPSPVPETGPVLAHGAKGTANIFAVATIKTLRYGALEIVINMPLYDQKIVPFTSLNGSTNTMTILLHKTPTVVMV
jgi:hypothetical protein